jgi:hypothetical protein
MFSKKFKGGGGWIGVYKSADPPKFEAKSAIQAKILDKSAICCINKIRNRCKTFARSEIRTIFSVKSEYPKTYSPSPPLKNELWNFMVDTHGYCTHFIIDRSINVSLRTSCRTWRFVDRHVTRFWPIGKQKNWTLTLTI